MTKLCNIVEAHGPEIDAAAAELGGDPAEIAYGLVPRQGRPVSSLPDERRTEFGSRLDQLVTLAFTDDRPVPQTERDGEEPENPLTVAACATCAGQCCTLGAPAYAFLTVETIQRFRQRNPGTTGAEVAAHYLGRLPERSVEESCVYHGEHGCALPRTERSDVCNRYHCGPLIQLGRRFDELGTSKALIVACDGKTAPVIGIHESGRGWHPLPAGEASGATAPHDPHIPTRSPAVAGTIAAAISLTPPPNE